MTKIGILTYYWSDNPGTFLQAYSTLKAFQQVFSDATVELAGCQHGKLQVHVNRSAALLYPLLKEVKRYFIYRKYQADYLNISPNRIVTNNTEEAVEHLKRQNYQVLVVGADTVLQLQAINRTRHNLPIYWIPPEVPAVKAACGTSCGALTFEELSEQQRAFCRNSLNGFKVLGVRDDATINLIRKLNLKNEIKVEKVPDPTFSYDIDYSFAESYVKRHHLIESRPMLAILTQKSFRFAEELAAHYRKRGFIVVSLARLTCSDVCLRDISPFEWAGLFRYFSFVVTDRFHGTVFSLKNETPVLSIVCEPRKLSAEGETKTQCLLKDFDLEKTNFVNTIELKNYAEFRQVLERAKDSFNRERVAMYARELGKRYLGFVEQVRKIL